MIFHRSSAFNCVLSLWNINRLSKKLDPQLCSTVDENKARFLTQKKKTLFCDDIFNLALENIFGECGFDESEDVNNDAAVLFGRSH